MDALLLSSFFLLLLVLIIVIGSTRMTTTHFRERPTILIGKSDHLVHPGYSDRFLQRRLLPMVEVLEQAEGNEPQIIIGRNVDEPYFITYPKRIYINQLFSLKVQIGGSSPKDQDENGVVFSDQGRVRFSHKHLKGVGPIPDPLVRVALKFNEDELIGNDLAITKALKQDETTSFLFTLKPLKSEDVAILIHISYVGQKWIPEKIAGITISDVGEKTTTTKTMIPGKLVADSKVITSESISISVESFLGLNGNSVNILSKGLAILLSVFYVVLAISQGRTDDPLNALIVGITAIAGSLGIPLGADLWKNLREKQSNNNNTRQNA